MKITIAGASGQIARLLHPILISGGHDVRGLVRKKDQIEELESMGVEGVLADIEKEDDISDAVGNADAVVFAAGAGPGSGAERKWTVDRDGAIKLMDAAKKNDVSRYVMISAMGLDTPRGDDVFRVYQKAKAEADEALRKSGLEYTIIKPGRLTNDNGTGNIATGQLERGEIPREDVARVIAMVLEKPETAGLEFDLLSGNDSIEGALKKLVVEK